MEYAKLFYNGWYKRPHTDKRIVFKEYLNRQWWLNASEEEKLAEYQRMEEKKHSLQRAKQALAFASAFTTFGYYGNDSDVNKGKYW